ncbi:glutamine amidotransferase-related protein [Paracoccus sp. Ld10]|uniref:glutamine amidotransferase-related protein n=1 Tax=Paracoccus sp. Ld10 TaxID=649158 RepID=UPI0038679D03
MPLCILVVASETKDQRAERRRYADTASHESYILALEALRDDLTIASTSCVDGRAQMALGDLAQFDGIIFAGSPIQMHHANTEARMAADFMRRVFGSGTPSFGSCAGLQIAAVAAGGATGPRRPGIEAAFARNIVTTEQGRDHPMLSGRPSVWTAPAMHSSIVTALPPSARVLAWNADTPVEAAEIRHENGIFWGVQYHPEISLAEIAASLRRQSSDLVKEGLAVSLKDVEDHADRLQSLSDDPARRDLSWQLGVDDQVTDVGNRMREIGNFLAALDGGTLRAPTRQHRHPQPSP